MNVKFGWRRLAVVGGVLLVWLGAFSPARSAQFPGGFLQPDTSTDVRPVLTPSQIQGFLPSRGAFTFPAPYNTRGIRLTNASDCGGQDCVDYIGYSYWRNMNDHVGSDTMLIFVGLDRARGGPGPTLFQYNKTTDQVTKLGPLFDSSSKFSWSTGEGWYFSASMPTKLYINDGSKMLRYDVLTKTFETVFDAATQFGSDVYIWQMSSSDDDLVHAATLRQDSTYANLGCMAYRTDTKQFYYYPKQGAFDECQIDKSGRWLVIKENVDGQAGVDNVIVDLKNGTQRVLLDQDGAGGHSDLGFGYMIAQDNWDSHPNAYKLWNLLNDPLTETLVYHNLDWSVQDPDHLSFENAAADTPISQQYACGSSANRTNTAFANEVICFGLDGSQQVLVVAPVMTNLDATGGGSSDYAKAPKGNLDLTGRYFIWTSNMGGPRADAFLVKVPSQLLTGTTDTTPPSVSIASPAAGASVSSPITVSADATDNVGVAGVQFEIDGTKLGAEVTAAPYQVSLDPATVSAGAHTLTAVARDAAGNTATSAPVGITVLAAAPIISGVSSSSTSSASASVTWNTDVLADSEVEYGLSTSYGNTTTLDSSLVSAHDVQLNGLQGSSVYHYRVKSWNSAGDAAVSGDYTLATPPSSGTDGTPSPLGSWPLDEGSGTVTADTSGNGADGTLSGAPAWIAGIAGKALAFDGTDDLVEIADPGIFDSYPLSVAFWFKTGAAAGLQGLVNKYWPSAMNGYQVFVNGGNLCAWYFRDASNYIWDGSGCTLSTPGFADKQWHYVVFTVDASGGKLYVDGKQTASRGWTGSPGPATTTRPVDLGSYPGTAQPYFAGALDEVSLYSQSLTAQQVGALYAGFPKTQGVAWADPTNVTVTGDSLQKTSGCDGCQDAGAVSQQQIASGDGSLTFTATETNTLREAGLSSGSPSTALSAIDFGIRLQDGDAEVLESGGYRTDTKFVSGDIFRIAVQGGIVKYYKNGVLIYTSTASPTYPLQGQAAILSTGGTVTNAVISTGP